MNQQEIGSFIKELRKENHLTQEQLAEKLGVTNRSISRWENGITMPDFDLVIEMTNYFHISVDELLDGKRKTEMEERKNENELLKVAAYTQDGHMLFMKRLNRLYWVAVLAFGFYLYLEIKGLASQPGLYENMASCALGLILGCLLVSILFTSRYQKKIYAFKQRIIKRHLH